MQARSAAPEAGRGPVPGRFGVVLGDFGLLLPAGLPCEFVDAADVHPVPGAPPRLRGLMQRHGRPLPVFGLSPAATFGRQRLRVLVIDEGRNAAALEIDFPPEPVELAATCDESAAYPGACPPGALERAWRCAGHDEAFWEFEPARFFALLGGRR
jgi:hypothetical protein